MKQDPTEYHRRSIRLKGHDYSQPGAYFVTICTSNWECLLGEVVGGAMRLNEVGQIARDEWLRTGIVRRNVLLDTFVVMPNHLHGVIIIEGDLRWDTRGSVA